MSAGAVGLPHPTIAPSPDAARFWEACRRGELVLPYCPSCERFFFYPRTLCPGCGSRDTDWRRVSGRGRVYAFCIHHHSGLPEFRDATPFVTAIVELDEGPRMMTLLTGVDPDPQAISCDMPVEVAFTETRHGDVLPAFAPRDGTHDPTTPAAAA